MTMNTQVKKHAGIGGDARAFTLVELMVSVSILVILMLVVANFVALVQRTWVRTNSNVSQFREARVAFDILTKNLSQATLNTYYQNEVANLGQNLGEQITSPLNYARQSELQFVCGPSAGTGGILASQGANVSTHPGHAVFFQAPLGEVRLQANANGTANTENMVNLLCGRGYWVEWGSDAFFRPAFLNELGEGIVPQRRRLRLMQYSPTAEQNQIYRSNNRPIINNSMKWFNDALASGISTASETKENKAATRPVAENILALIISPQLETTNATLPPYSIAPNYRYDSTLISNDGANVTSFGPQGTRHLLPPLLKVTMIALDASSGERLSSDPTLLTNTMTTLGGIFKSVSRQAEELGGQSDKPGTLDTYLNSKRLNYRVFTSTIALKQGRWGL